MITAARAQRDGNGDPQPVHVEVDEPVIVSSPVKRTIANRSRRWQDWQAKRAAEQAARQAVEAEHDLGLPGGVTYTRSAPPDPPTFGPYGIPWSQVQNWLARGWRP